MSAGDEGRSGAANQADVAASRVLSALAATNRVLAASNDLNGVLAFILEQAGAIAATKHAFLYLPDGDGDLAVRAGTGVFARDLGFTLKPGEGVGGRVWQSGAPLEVSDYQTWEGRSERFAVRGTRAIVAVPLKAGDKVSGVLGIARLEPGGFAPIEVEALAAFAVLAGVTLENTRLVGEARREVLRANEAEAESQRRLGEALVVNRVISAASGSLNQEKVLDAVCQAVAEGFGVERAGLALLSPDGASLRIAASFDAAGGPCSGDQVVPVRGNASARLALGKLVVVPVEDVASDDRVAAIRDLLLARGARAVIIAPLISGGRALGTLAIDFPEARAFTLDEVNLAGRCALIAAQALENARLHESLRESESHNRALLDAIPDLLFRLDASGRYLDAKGPVGVGAENVVGKVIEEVLPQPAAAAFRTALEETLEKGGVRSLEYHIERARGPRDYEARLAPGGKGDVIVLVQDVTARVRAFTALAASRQRFADLVDSVDGIVWESDAQARTFTFVNAQAERILGYPRERWLRERGFWEAHLHPDDQERVLAETQAGLQSGRPYSLEYRMVAADGRVVWLRAVVSPVETTPPARHLRGLMTDVTERKLAEALERDSGIILEMVARGEPLSGTLEEVARMIEEQRPGMTAAVLLVEGARLVPAAAPAFPPGFLTAARDSGGLPLNDPAELASGRMIVPDVANDPRWEPYRPLLAALGLRSCWLMGVRGGDGRALGALVLLGRNSRGPRDADARTLERAARLAALAVERRELSARLEHQATHDALTGLPNRALFLDRLQQALASAQRGAHMAAVMFIDLDRFKHINDTLGHAVGDALLREVSTRLSAVTRDSDTLARMGGDEFTLVAGRIDDARGAVIIAEKLLSAFRQPFPVGEHELFVTASLGVSLYPQDGEDAASLQRNADIAMYRAKAGGKNQYEFFQPEMSADAVEHLALENDLRRAVERGEFELHYQPVLDLASGRVVSLEALLRWRHPARGLLHPQHFLPVAEESGLIGPIGEWALREACRQTAAWQAAGLPATRASVNVSALQMGRDDLREVVAAALNDAKLDARWLELEVSERVLVNNVNASIDLLGRVRELGVRVAIDDFGRGHSSLLYLHRLPVDSLKVEGTFVRALESSGNARPLVQAVVALAHSLKLEAVAESVENEAQLQAVRELGCDLAQGYLWSPALPAEQIAALLRAPGYRGAPDIN